MRISDWSSDVCSSDLVLDAAGYTKRRHDHIGGSEPAADIGHGPGHDDITPLPQTLHLIRRVAADDGEMRIGPGPADQRKYVTREGGDRLDIGRGGHLPGEGEIGRAPCRERVCQDG